MISPKAFYEALVTAGVNFISGVPDSLLKEFCTFAEAALPLDRHIIAVNEGAAIAIATGVQLATGGVPLVYLQNSGLGNAVNPLLSLTDPEVYAIPLVLMIGWRGQPGHSDEPQHIKQGRVTPALLKAMEIPFEILNGDSEAAHQLALRSVKNARERSGPVVILVQKNSFEKSELSSAATPKANQLLRREHAIEVITSVLPIDTTVVSTTGHISRELCELRAREKKDSATDFLTVGSMGHASQIALGIAISRPKCRVACLDGDGAALMHMGGLATIGTSGASNFIHVLLNNGVHDSVGGQPSAGLNISFTSIASACGYSTVHGPLLCEEDIRNVILALKEADGPSFLEVRVSPGARPELGRPKESLLKSRKYFTDRLRQL